MSTEVRVLRLGAVCDKTGLRKSQIYRLESLGRFPARIKLSDRASGWVLTEIDHWILERIQASRVRGEQL